MPSISVPTRLVSHPPTSWSLISLRNLSSFNFFAFNFLDFISMLLVGQRSTSAMHLGLLRLRSFPCKTNSDRRRISGYVRSVVHYGSSKFMKRWRKEDKEHVIETLSERADGM